MSKTSPPDARNWLGVWLPSAERHFCEMMTPGRKSYHELPDGRPAYQRHKYLAALEHTPGREVFIDVGAHVGLWAYQAERDFNHVISFEPVAAFADIYPYNMRSARWTLHRVALGDRDGLVSLDVQPENTGCTHIHPGAAGDIPLRPLDSYGIDCADLIKIDVEGYELPVVKGAAETIMRCRPTIIIEQKGNDQKNFGASRRDEAVDYLRGLGMTPLRPAMAGDWLMGWR